MANKALGRDLRDLLSRSRPMRFVERAAGASADNNHVPARDPVMSSAPAPQPLELPFERPSGPERVEASSQRAQSTVSPAASRSSRAGVEAELAPVAGMEREPVPLPGPATVRTTLWFPFLLAVDIAFLIAAIVAVFDPRVPRPLGWYLAGGAVFAGAICGSLAFAVRARSRARAAERKQSVRVRIQLTRL